MKKIYLCDDLGNTKTTKELIKHLKSKYDYKYSMYWDPAMTDWSDIGIVEWGANNAIQCSKWEWKGIKYDWKDKRIIVRIMDIEAYAGQYKAINWNHVTDLVYTAKHIFEMVDKEMNFKDNYPHLRIWHIPLSVDMNEWTYANRSNGLNIAVVGKMWAAKSPEMIFQMASMLPSNFKIHILGGWESGTWGWMQTYRDNIIKSLGLENNINLITEKVQDLNSWYDKTNYLVTFSQKDSFSLPVAEAMAKGIKSLPHNFWGAKNIWGKYVWSSLPELVKRITEESYNSQEYHNYVKDNYSNEVIMKKWEDVINYDK